MAEAVRHGKNEMRTGRTPTSLCHWRSASPRFRDDRRHLDEILLEL
jgi:hypothetical protein